MTSDLAAWLRQHLDEDERLARAACWDDQSDVWTARPPQARYEQYTVEDYLGDGVVVVAPYNADPDGVGQHVAEHDPARVLRAVAGKRRILDLYVEHARLDRETFEAEGQHARSLVSLRAAYLDAVRAFATEYAHRPGYREEWKP